MKNQAKWAGSIRHVLTIAGGALVAGGYTDESTVQQIVGGFMALAGLILSWTSPAKKEGKGDPE